MTSWVTHRHPDFWAEPDRFDPRRFASSAESTRHKLAHFPFGAGLRRCVGLECVGSDLAVVETIVPTAMIVQPPRLRAGPAPSG